VQDFVENYNHHTCLQLLFVSVGNTVKNMELFISESVIKQKYRKKLAAVLG